MRAWVTILLLAAVLGGGCRTGPEHGQAQPGVPRDAARIIGDAGALEVSEDGQTWRKGETGVILRAESWVRSGAGTGGNLALDRGAIHVRLGPDTVLRLNEIAGLQDDSSRLLTKLGLIQGRLLTEIRAATSLPELRIMTSYSSCMNSSTSSNTQWETGANGEVRVLDGVVVNVDLSADNAIWVIQEGQELRFVDQGPSLRVTNCPPATLRRVRREFRDMARVPR